MATIVVAIFLLLLCGLSSCSGAFVGLSYDGNDSRLPSPLKLMEVLKEHEVTHVRLLDANRVVLEVLSNTGIEVSVGLSNRDVQSIGRSKSQAAAWVKTHILRFVRNSTLITSIVVGNEAVCSEEAAASLVPAMKAIHSALVAAKLSEKIKVSTAFSSSLIESSFHPSRAFFSKKYEWVLQPLLAFVSRTGSFLVLNAESHNHCRPYNTDFVQSAVDSAHNAMAALHHSNIPLVIGELCLLTRGRIHAVSPAGMNTKLFAIYMSFSWDKESKDKAVSSSYSGFFRELLGRDGVRPIPDPNQTAMTASFFSGNDSKITPTPTSGGNWCVAKNNVDDSTLQVALDYACGLGGADCGAIQQGGVCFDPDNVQAHASYAFNNYYMKNGMLPGTCDFGGSAAVTILNPSHGNCVYQTSSGSSILNGTIPGGTITGLGPSASNNSGAMFIRPLRVLISIVNLIVAVALSERL